ncbi:DUF4097 family beta strand repeat-containing protein [Mollicutes bacterium LVI A0039]|nr:DUF4097 family beta strand repeat-containing protein [Mollicutes bacterium LVI A0039]
MKYFYSIGLFLLFLILCTKFIEFNYKQDVQNIDLNQNPIENIIVDFDDANVTVSTTVDNDIKIEHIYSEENNPTSNIYTYQEGETLYVSEYSYNRSNLITKKETVNIYIPEQAKINSLKIVNISGQSSVDGLIANDINIQSTTGNVDVSNIDTANLIVDGDHFGVSISNSIIKTLSSNIGKTQFNVTNTIANNVALTNTEKATLNIAKLVTDSVILNGPQTNVNLNLNEEIDYALNTTASIKNEKLTKTETGYEYRANNQKSITEYQLNTERIITVEFEAIGEGKK